MYKHTNTALQTALSIILVVKYVALWEALVTNGKWSSIDLNVITGRNDLVQRINR